VGKLRLLLAPLVIVTLLLAADWASRAPWTAQAEFPEADLSTSLIFDCLPDTTIRVGLRWQTALQGPQWLDLSLLNNNFEGSSFVGMGPLPPNQTAFTWDGLTPASWHFVRINTYTPSGWQMSRPMAFRTPDDCRYPGSARAYYPPPPPRECLSLPASDVGCVWTGKADFDSYSIREPVIYCYQVTQPMQVRIIATKPDRTIVTVTDRFDPGTGACIGPYEANVPFGLRTVAMYGGPSMQLLSETHFFVR